MFRDTRAPVVEDEKDASPFRAWHDVAAAAGKFRIVAATLEPYRG